MCKQMEQYEQLKEILKTIKNNIQDFPKNWIEEHKEILDTGTQEEKDFILSTFTDSEKASKKNLRKLKEIEEFLFLFL